MSTINLQRISVSTFHKIALDTANFSSSYLDDVDMTSDWWDYELPVAALENAQPKYDAVLIDEYQDFKDDWIRLCLQLCKQNVDVEPKFNLFFAGDRLQSIHNAELHSWRNDFDLDMRGRSKLLKISYRAGKQNIALALKFLQNHSGLKDEVERFYRPESEDLDLSEAGLEFVEGGYQDVSDKVQLLVDNGLQLNEILVLCLNQSSCEELISLLSADLQDNSVFVEDIGAVQYSSHLKFTTYHCAKGVEVKAVILVDTDQFNLDELSHEIIERKLMYVGITRASEILIVHANDFAQPSFGSELRNLV